MARDCSVRVFAILASLVMTPVWGETFDPEMPSLGKLESMSAEFDRLFPDGAVIEVLASGFRWTEGPLWVQDDHGGHVLFSDIPRNTVFRWREGSGIDVFLQPAGYTGPTLYGREPGSNGLLLDGQGRLVSCEHGDRRLSVLTKGGGKRTLVDNYQGKRLNSPNDAVRHSSGDLFFTDPCYGLPEGFDDPRRELDFCGVFRFSAASGELSLVTDQMTRPNGIALSPSEDTLYVAQSDPKAAVWRAFPLSEDGSVGEGRVFYDVTDLVGQLPGLPDGMAVDADGRLWATGPGGVLVFTAAGRLLGRLNTGRPTANCGFGEDGQTLFITASSHLCRIRTRVRGVAWK